MSVHSNGKCADVRLLRMAPLVMLLVIARPVIGDELMGAPDLDRISAADGAAAIRRAETAINGAHVVGNLWLGTRATLTRARAYQDSGDYDNATRLAAIAQSEAVLALNQHQLEKARYQYHRLKHERDQDPTRLEAISGLLKAYDGEAALRLVRELSGDKQGGR